MSNQSRAINKSIGASESINNRKIQNHSLEIQNTNNHTSQLSKEVHNFEWYKWQQKYTIGNQTRPIHKSKEASELITDWNIKKDRVS